jgi:hypothetical protein
MLEVPGEFMEVTDDWLVRHDAAPLADALAVTAASTA